MKSSFKKVLGSLSALALAVVTTVPAYAEGPSVSGFVDFGYNYNFNGEQTNVLRTFDSKANSFTLQNAEIVVTGKSAKDVVYRVDLNFGQDASVTNYLNKNAGDELDIQQAFISKVCPITGATFTFGKFVTPFGVEVIDAKDNFNISRGLLFNYAIPLNHTGIKADKSFGALGLTAGIVNGWDNMYDTNTGKTAIFQAAMPFGDKLKVVLGGAYGPEQDPTVTLANANQNGRGLVDAIVTVTAIDKLTLIGNIDWGVEEGLANKPDQGTQNWSGLGLHANYAVSDAWSVAGRYETMTDEGTRFLQDVDGDTINNDEVTVNSITLTLQHKMDDVITRLEYRMDSSDEDIFLDDKGAADGGQATIGLQWIYAF